MPVVNNLKKNYDFIFVTVRREQVEEALQTLKDCPCKNIVTMVNTAESYEKWEKILGKGRLIPAFPGAGGRNEGKSGKGIVDTGADSKDKLWGNFRKEDEESKTIGELVSESESSL